MNQRNLYRIIIGALMLVSGLIITVFQPGGFFFGTILITGGCAFVAVGILRHRQYRDGPESDERSKKIGAYGLSYAWLTGIIFISVLYWLGHHGHPPFRNTGCSRTLFDGACNICRDLSDIPVPKRGC